MKLLAFSDLHRDLEQAAKLVEMSADADVVIGAGDFASVHEGLEETIGALAAIETPTVLVPGNNETADALRDAAAGWERRHRPARRGDDDRRGRVLRPRRRHPGHPLGLELRPRRRGGRRAMLAACPEGAVLVLHSPPKGHCDASGDGDHFGSPALLRGDRGEAAAARRLRPHPRVLGLRERGSARRRSATSARPAPGSSSRAAWRRAAPSAPGSSWRR